jgi:dTDP-4-dehydrorhamnose 3,5-epimerase-like enzyme
MTNINNARLIELPKIFDMRGNLSFFESNNQIPFEIKRTYWIYDVPGGAVRSGHAYKTSSEIIIALSGSFDVIVNDGINEHCYTLNRSYTGLYVPKKTWRGLENFSTNSVAFIAASETYDEFNYIRDFNDFLNYAKE